MIYDYGFTVSAFFLALFCFIFMVTRTQNVQHEFSRSIFRVLVVSVLLTPLFSFISTIIDEADLGSEVLLADVRVPGAAVYCSSFYGTCFCHVSDGTERYFAQPQQGFLPFAVYTFVVV